MLSNQDGRNVYAYDAEQLWVEAWGRNAVRVRSTKTSSMPVENWALLEPAKTEAQVEISHESATLINGKIKAVVTKRGKLTIWNTKGKILLEEYARNRRDVTDPKCSALEVEAREFKPIIGGDMYGDKYLCCPVLQEGKTQMSAYLPQISGGGQWKAFRGDKTWNGGATVTVDCPLERMPIFERG
ncbi:hypothetical protein EK21DRAFT_113766 [Setomelanomma holmii]|uniref:Glycosyl hydrolase family 31 C-terminal domain-containing protein n=1 Tax=Setomelanomma holmii TaxID=210430 RepID=A0A9P4H5K5_9PLEO|nr:hypothetical protein EK21DRAFT_113766 [Setomelanomma holmii]